MSTNSENSKENENNLDNKINEYIQSYFKLKNDYETLNYEKYIQPIIFSNKSKKEKKYAFQKLPKYNCINCKRNVGSIFSIKKSNSSSNHIYTAICGDINNPCPLNINIEMPNVGLFEDLLEENGAEWGSINVLKNKIIKAKNDLLFGYIKKEDAFNLFENLTNELTEDLKLYDNLLETKLNITDNLKKNQLLKKTQIELEIYIQEFKTMIQEYKNNNNETIIINAVEFYVNTIEIKLKEVLNLKYSINRVELLNNQFILNQIPFAIEQLEFKFNDPIIHSFIQGKGKINQNISIKNNVTIKNKVTKNKTLKSNIKN